MSKPGAHGTNLVELAHYILREGPKRVLPAGRRVRVLHNRAFVVDTLRAAHVWEHDAYPQFYVPEGELRGGECALRDKTLIHHHDDDDDGDGGQERREGKVVVAAVCELTVPGASRGLPEVKTDRVLRFTEECGLRELAGMVRLEFGSMDQWLEEDVPIYVHPKDPFKRIDTLPSQRPVEVRVAGHTVARAAASTHLLETGLPTRYYLPLTAVADQACLRPSELVTRCPYKGEAQYYHVVVGGEEYRDLAWYYRFPTHESAGVAGLVCFYNEKVDILLDGELLERPKTWFS